MSSNRPQRPDRPMDDDVRRDRGPREGRPARDPREGRPAGGQRPPRPPRDVDEPRPARGPRPDRDARSARPVRAERPARPAAQMPAMPAIDLSSMDLSAGAIQKGIAELIGTFLLTYIGIASILSGGLPAAFAFGMALLVIVYSIGHVSGAHVNPAVSLGLAATGNFSWGLVPIYVIMQTIGAILAGLMLKLTHTSDNGLGVTHLGTGVGVMRGFAIELVCTAILVFVIHAVATDKRAPAAVTGLAIGFALFCIAGVAGDLTGGSFNPARSIGPALVDTDFKDLWVYLVAPLIGGVIGGMLYQIVSNDTVETDPSDHPVESIR